MSNLYRSEEAQADADSITLLRILDTLYLILRAQDPKAYQLLVDEHANGGVIGPLTAFEPDQVLADQYE